MDSMRRSDNGSPTSLLPRAGVPDRSESQIAPPDEQPADGPRAAPLRERMRRWAGSPWGRAAGWLLLALGGIIVYADIGLPDVLRVLGSCLYLLGYFAYVVITRSSPGGGSWDGSGGGGSSWGDSGGDSGGGGSWWGDSGGDWGD